MNTVRALSLRIREPRSMVLDEKAVIGRFFALRLGVVVTLILIFGFFSQIVALAALLGYAGPALALAAVVVVSAVTRILTGIRHQHHATGPGALFWTLRALMRELILVGGLVAIGVGHSDAGWPAAVIYLLWTGGEALGKRRRSDGRPRRESRRSVARRRAAIEVRLRKADAAIQLAETVMVGSPDDEDVQSAAQQLRLAATNARRHALEALRETHSAEIPIQARGQARLRAALAGLGGGQRVEHTAHWAGPVDPRNVWIQDRWTG